jgi:RNA polymerase sigma-70 factor (ECF subfamily)
MSETLRLAEFVNLHTRHDIRLRALAFSLVPNWADAEEILQQANLVLWQKFGDFRTGTNFFAWASQIVRLTAKDFLARQRRAKVRFSDQFYDLVAQETTDLADELAERERLLRDCVAKLKARQRDVVRLRYHDGKPVADVAGVLGTTAKAIYHALEHIHAALHDCVSRGLHPTAPRMSGTPTA